MRNAVLFQHFTERKKTAVSIVDAGMRRWSFFSSCYKGSLQVLASVVSSSSFLC